MNNNYEFLLTKRDSLSSDGTNEHDICTIKEEVAQYRDKVNEWTVFHFAAYFKSDSIVEWLIEFLTDIPGTSSPSVIALSFFHFKYIA